MKIEINQEDWCRIGIIAVIIILVAGCVLLAFGLGKSDQKVKVIHYEKQIIEREIISQVNNSVYMVPENLHDCIRLDYNDSFTYRCEK